MEFFLQSTDRHSSSSGGTMMNESPSHNAAAAVTTRFPEKPSSNSESPSSLVDSAIGGSASPDLMQVMIYRASHVLVDLGWVDLDLRSSPGWWASTIATDSPSRVVEHPKSKSTKPSLRGHGTPCTVG